MVVESPTVVVEAVVVVVVLFLPLPNNLEIKPGFLVVVVILVVVLVVVVDPNLAVPVLTTVLNLQVLKVLVQNEASLQSPLNSKGPHSYLMTCPLSTLFMLKEADLTIRSSLPVLLMLKIGAVVI